MCRRHLYVDTDLVTPEFVATKQSGARRSGARFASIAFVTGTLDSLPSREEFHTLVAAMFQPTLIVCGASTRPKAKAKMAAIARRGSFAFAFGGFAVPLGSTRNAGRPPAS